MATPDVVPLPNTNQGDFHFVFKHDPREFLSLVQKYIKVETKYNTEHIGYVYTVDPVTGSYVLMKPSEDNHEIAEIVVVLGHTVRQLTILDEQHSKETCETLTACMNARCNKLGDKSLAPEEIVQKREKILTWLRKNLIPIKQDPSNPNTLTLMNVVQIMPPYDANSCYSENEVILGKIQGLLSAMPNELCDDDL